MFFLPLYRKRASGAGVKTSSGVGMKESRLVTRLEFSYWDVFSSTLPQAGEWIRRQDEQWGGDEGKPVSHALGVFILGCFFFHSTASGRVDPASRRAVGWG